MPTLTQYRARAATILGQFVTGLAQNATGTKTELVDGGRSMLKSSTASIDTYDDWYLFRPNVVTSRSDGVRRVASYDPTSGIFTPDDSWSQAVGALEAFELHGLIEPFTAMADCINEGLKRCFLTKEATLTPVALAQRHSLATLTWIDEPWKIRSVGFLSAGQSREQNNPYLQTVRGYVTNEAGVFYINHPGQTFAATDTIYLWTVARHYDVCNGNLGAQVGLTLETDTATAPLDWVARAALIEAFERFSTLLDPSSNQRLLTNQEKCAAVFSALRKANFQLPALTFEPLVALGPYPNFVGYY